MQAYLEQTIERINGLKTIILSDKEGIPIIKVNCLDDFHENSNLTNIFTFANDQAGKLNFGKNRQIINYFKDHILVHVSISNHITASFIGGTSMNVGLLSNIIKPFKHSLLQFSKSFETSL